MFLARTVAVVASGFSPTVQVVGGYGRGVFVKEVCGVATQGRVNEGDQILRVIQLHSVSCTIYTYCVDFPAQWYRFHKGDTCTGYTISQGKH